MPWWAWALVALFAAIPTPTLALFDGLPVDRPLEFIVFVLLAALIASPTARDAAFGAFGAAGRRAIAGGAAAGIAVKLLLVVHGGHSGFIACYHGGIAPAAVVCDRSFDNPFDRFAATRVDPRIQFDGPGWRLGLLNALRFDALRRDDAYQPPVPFSVLWESVSTAPAAARVRLRYRGEAAIDVDGNVAAFPADYSPSGADRNVELPAGRHRVVTSYRFAPPEAPPSPVSITSALMRLDSPPAIRWGTASRLDLAGGWIVDLLALITCGTMIGGLARKSPRDAAEAAALVVVALLLSVAPIGAFGRDKAIELLIVAGCVMWIWRKRGATSLAALALAALCMLRVWSGTGPAPGTAEYRLQGNDGLTYESFAHDILDERSPQGGERVFSLQILFRYIRFAERMLFGEGDWLLLAAVLTAVNASYTWLGRRAALMASRYRATLLVVTAIMLWMMNGASGAIEAPMSEYPTWLLLPLSMGLLFLGRTRREWIAGAALMGLAALTRLNQLPAYVCLLFVFALAPAHAFSRPRWSDVLSCAAALCVVSLGLPMAHNYWYGHSLTWLPTNRYSTLVIDLPPAAFFSGNQRAVWTMFAWKMEHLTHLGAEYATSWFVPLHLLQLALLSVAIAAARGRVCVARGHAWLAAAPVVALGVHLFYVVHFYYPRHIMFGYLLGGVVALVWIAEDGLAVSRTPAGALT
jgi:hypothetical protein